MPQGGTGCHRPADPGPQRLPVEQHSGAIRCHRMPQGGTGRPTPGSQRLPTSQIPAYLGLLASSPPGPKPSRPQDYSLELGGRGGSLSIYRVPFDLHWKSIIIMISRPSAGATFRNQSRRSPSPPPSTPPFNRNIVFPSIFIGFASMFMIFIFFILR